MAAEDRRVGQLNMTEHDPVALDVEERADYWASLEVDAALVSVTGILVFGRTKEFGTRDFFGDCLARRPRPTDADQEGHPFLVNAGTIEFTNSKVLDYEVADLYYA
jgi:hypothetical protein